jgi:hypothetical protein
MVWFWRNRHFAGASCYFFLVNPIEVVSLKFPNLCSSIGEQWPAVTTVIIKLVHKLTVLHQFKFVRHSGELA